MAEAKREVIDSQIIAENVGFLDGCFENSFSLQRSLIVAQEYIAEEQNEQSNSKVRPLQQPKKSNTSMQNKTLPLDTSTQSNTVILSQFVENDKVTNRNLKDWGLPQEIARKYELKGITDMFEWQFTCLRNPKVLMECCNLVYSAPTSAGKTLVAEIITIKTVLERQKKVIIILPFVSIVREKMFYLQDILSSSGIRVEGFMGSQSPPGGLNAVHVAICTIEKANSLVNKLLEEGNIAELGAVIVDELHLLGDPHRGYILELLLTKIKYVAANLDDVKIQIVGMSATLPNLEVLAEWLNAELFLTKFRPIPLDEFCLVENQLYNKHGELVSTIDAKLAADDGDNVLQICLNTIKEGCSVLIFCMTKNRCENLAQSIASSFYKLGCVDTEMGAVLRQQLNSEKILEVLEQMKNCPVGLDQILKKSISFGVAFHHAGLTFDERDIIEGGFKSGAIRVLVATSTLSSGVNLPARKLIIRTPVFQRTPIDILTYKQMVGRAGRMGKDTKGESVLICTKNEKNIGFALMKGGLNPVKSCIESGDKYMRAVLEMIASEVACTRAELDLYSKCTLLFIQQNIKPSDSNLLKDTLAELKKFELVRIQKDHGNERYVATPLGKACLSSSMAPNDGLSLFCELQNARQCLVLDTDLHLVYLVTPYSVSSQWGEIDWLHLLTLWHSLTKSMKRVGELVGVKERFIIRHMNGANKIPNIQQELNIHKRFYTALALQDLINEVPLSEVATKFQCARGFLQGLQQAAATFAGMVAAFTHQLGWKNIEMLIGQFQDRLHFGIHSELLELMKLSSLNGMRARALFDAGFETISSIASADANVIENTLHKVVPFQSEKERDEDDNFDMKKRNKIKNIWITGCCGMTTREAAENLILEARKYLELEIGVAEIKWNKTNSGESGDVKTNNMDTNVKLEIETDHIGNSIKLSDEIKEASMTNQSENVGNSLEDHIEISDSEDIYHSNIEIKDEFDIDIKDEIIKSPTVTREANSKVIDNHCSIITVKSKKDEIADTKRSDRNSENSPSIINSIKLSDKIKEQRMNNQSENIGDSIEEHIEMIDSEDIYHCDVEIKVEFDIDIKDEIIESPTVTREANSKVKENHCSIITVKSKKDEIADTKCSNRNSEHSPSILKDDIIWDSMNFTEAAIQNVSKLCNSDQIFSPNISFGDTDDISMVSTKTIDNIVSSKSTSVKDVSLFSSDGNNSSLFDESLPLDLIPSKIFDDRKTQTKTVNLCMQETVSDFLSINSNSILNVFKCTIIEGDEEENIKLEYEDDNKMSGNKLETGFNLSEDIIETQEINATAVNITNCIKSYKRQAGSSKDKPVAKKAKITKSITQPNSKASAGLIRLLPKVKVDFTSFMKLNSTKSKTFTLEVNKIKMKCLILREMDVIDNFYLLEKLYEIAIYLDLNTNPISTSSEIIGGNIIKQTRNDKDDTESNNAPLIKGIATYYGENTCVYLDFTSLAGKLDTIKIYLERLFKNVKLRVMSLKSAYVNIKKCFGLELPHSCTDLSLAEWLMNCDERITNILYLAEQYFGIVLPSIPMKIDGRETKLQNLDAYQNMCLKAWAVWGVAENQNLLKGQIDRRTVKVELHVAKILAECEYHGLTVDKDLASQLLIDVKNSQEILQKKAYRICGYHFNFNSSKDVAKALGIYKGRKISTKKSVLTAHNSPIASIVIFWRKLNSILTKTLYPLTEKACIYSDGNRIKPSYTMYIRTGRISMHEPNLQNVPRTFYIPLKYVSENELSDDVVEFNCRNIFKAAEGHVLVSADYCQLEMRILTHYSRDEVLTRIMNSDMDVFKTIAASLGGVPESEVDDDLRQKAKQICYGILYGMCNKTLSLHLDVTEMEAAVFMDTFHNTYRGIKVFTESVIQDCRTRGYVETLMKRRRVLPGINSSFRFKRHTSERQAINTTIQGSAADIVKTAMCALDSRTDIKARLILQMHDELIYEVPEEDKHTFCRVLKDVMEGTLYLSVPLPVKVRSGYTWGSLEEIKF